MSFDALAWAAKCRVPRSADKLVLLALADRHNPETNTAYPSVAWLAEFSSLNRKTVIAALGRLEAAGLIADSGERAGRTLQIKAFRLSLESIPKTERSQKRNSSTFSAKASQKRDTDTVLEPVPSEPNGSSGCAQSDLILDEKKAALVSCLKRAFPAPTNVTDEQWDAFCEQRKKKLNPRSYLLLSNKLAKLAEDGWPPGEMIDLAIERGWETVFAPRNFGNERSNNPLGDAVGRVIGAIGAHH